MDSADRARLGELLMVLDEDVRAVTANMHRIAEERAHTLIDLGAATLLNEDSWPEQQALDSPFLPATAPPGGALVYIADWRGQFAAMILPGECVLFDLAAEDAEAAKRRRFEEVLSFA